MTNTLTHTLTHKSYIMSCTEDGRRQVAVHSLSIEGLATLVWEAVSGECYGIFVKETHRREGLGTLLWAEAAKIAPIRHSQWRTDAGEAFALSVGGYMPPRQII